jgi:8-oxo-dGTP pyrophosphatase MutT (NUDIX family)
VVDPLLENPCAVFAENGDFRGGQAVLRAALDVYGQQPGVFVATAGDEQTNAFLQGYQKEQNQRALRANKQAAVLVPLVARGAQVSVLFTQRAAHLRAHAGQISFPGGQVDAGDASLWDTALRESEEEIGLRPENVTLLGMLPPYATVTGYAVSPVIGWVDPPEKYTIDRNEVDHVFEIPLTYILNPNHHKAYSRIFQGARRYFLAMPYQNYFIWGATAGMLFSFLDVMRHVPCLLDAGQRAAAHANS